MFHRIGIVPCHRICWYNLDSFLIDKSILSNLLISTKNVFIMFFFYFLQHHNLMIREINFLQFFSWKLKLCIKSDSFWLFLEIIMLNTELQSKLHAKVKRAIWKIWTLETHNPLCQPKIFAAYGNSKSFNSFLEPIVFNQLKLLWELPNRVT